MDNKEINNLPPIPEEPREPHLPPIPEEPEGDNLPPIPEEEWEKNISPIPEVQWEQTLPPVPEEQEEESTPPPVPNPADTPTPDQEWADALHINFTPPPPPVDDASTPGLPPTPQPTNAQRTPPPYPGDAAPNPLRTPQLSGAQMPNSYLAWGIIATILCCMIPGVVAIIYSTQVGQKWRVGDVAGAEKASERAQLWIIISIVTGIIWSAIYLPFTMIVESLF